MTQKTMPYSAVIRTNAYTADISTSSEHGFYDETLAAMGPTSVKVSTTYKSACTRTFDQKYTSFHQCFCVPYHWLPP